jgi:hypothetical protein
MSKLKSKALKRALALILSGALIMSGVTVYGEDETPQVQSEQNKENGGGIWE